MKLGIHIPLDFFSPEEAVSSARVVDAAGLDHVVVNDHLHLPWAVQMTEAWTTLAAIATVTQRCRLGPCVTPLPIRHPFLLAKMAATIDHLSSGRLLMGVGAGWYPKDFAWVAVPFHSLSDRLAQTEEALQLLRAFWTEPSVTFSGVYYQVQEVVLQPRPLQKPYPPILLGGGSKKILALTARYGVGWMPFNPTRDGLAKRLQQLESLLVDQGRTMHELQIMPSTILQLGKNQKEAKQQLPPYLQGWQDVERRMVLGSPEECIEQLLAFDEVGVTHMTLRLLSPTKAADDIDTIVAKIVPNL